MKQSCFTFAFSIFWHSFLFSHARNSMLSGDHGILGFIMLPLPCLYCKLLLRISIIIALCISSNLCGNYGQGQSNNILCEEPSVILYCYQSCEILQQYQQCENICDHQCRLNPYHISITLLIVGEKQATLCEGQNRLINCPAGKGIQIVSATYGRTTTAICRRSSNLMRNLNCHSKTSLTKVQKLCNKKSRCQLRANNGVFGDPCGGTYKYLHVEYNCIKGNIFLTLRNRNTYICVKRRNLIK